MPNLPWTHRSVCLLSIQGTAFGQIVVNTFHFEATTAGEASLTSDAAAQTSGATLAARWITVCKAAFLACLAGDYNMVLVRAQIIERPTLFRHKLTPTDDPVTAQGNSGASNHPAAEPAAAAVIKWRTPQAGKPRRGRVYLGPLSTNVQVDGRISAAGLTEMNGFPVAMMAEFGAAGTPANLDWRLTVYSKPYNYGEYGYARGHNPTRTFYYPPDYAGDSTNVTGHAQDPIIRTQRRRVLGVGA